MQPLKKYQKYGRNMLIVYASQEFPLRQTIQDHLYSFSNYGNFNTFYLNISQWRLPPYLKKIQYDLIVFHTTFLSQRWTKTLFKTVWARVRDLRECTCKKIILPQDEFINTSILNSFIQDMKIDQIYSVAPESEWQKIYDDIDVNSVRISQVMTGYLDARTIDRIEMLAPSIPIRDIDMGYRAWKAEPWLGRFGFLKTTLADEFARKASGSGLNLDISTEPNDTFFGDDWYRFLLKCRFTIGVEGGASILDREGIYRNRTAAYTTENPCATFEEIESNCFPGVDGSLNLRAISPRHLEACATKTCQVLIEGNYNGVLMPYRHYIPLKSDFSNIEEVISSLRDEDMRTRIVNQAYEDVVLSGDYSYECFVKDIINDMDMVNQQRYCISSMNNHYFLEHLLCWTQDSLGWLLISFRNYTIRTVKRILPQQVLACIKESRTKLHWK